jgi:hypothetical protein
MNKLFLECIELLGRVKEHRESYSTVRKIKEYLKDKSFGDLNELDIKLYTLMQTFINNSSSDEIDWNFNGYSSYHKDWDFEPIYHDKDYGLFPTYKDEHLLESMLSKLFLNMTGFTIGSDFEPDGHQKLNMYGFQHCRTDFKGYIEFHVMGFKYNKNKKLGKTRGSVKFILKIINEQLTLSCI